MHRFRIPIIVLVAIVAIIALDFAVLRALFQGGSSSRGYLVPIDSLNWLPFATLALGVLPMASILVIVSMAQMMKMSRTSTVSRFWIGFQAFGWLAVFLFMSVSALSPAVVQKSLLVAESPFQPIFDAVMARTPPEWVIDGIEITIAIIVFLLPELLLAMAGGWMIRRLKSSVRETEMPHLSATVSMS